MRSGILKRISWPLVWLALLACTAIAHAAQLAGPMPERLAASPLSVADAIARRQHLHGTVMLDIQVQADGRVSDVAVGTTSGDAGLDLVADLSARSWTFQPGAAEKFSVSVTFAAPGKPDSKTAPSWPADIGLPAGAAPPTLVSAAPAPEQLDGVLWAIPTHVSRLFPGRSTYCEVLIGPDGAVRDVRALDPRFDLDYATILSLLFAERQTYKPALLQGHPIAVRVLQKITWPPIAGYMAEPPAITLGGPPQLAMLLARPASLRGMGTPSLMPFSYPGTAEIMRGGPRDSLTPDDLAFLLGPPSADDPPRGWQDMKQLDPAYRTGMAHLQDGDYDAAIGDFDIALLHTPNHPQYLADRGEALARRNGPGDAERALADHARIIRLVPDEIDGYFTRADTQRLLGHPEAALRDLNVAIFMAPDNVAVRVARARIERLLGDETAALADEHIADAIDAELRAYLQAGDQQTHVWQASIATPDAPARLDSHMPHPVSALALASSRHLSGHVALMVKVSRGGLAAEIKIAQSSGYPVLDASAILSASHWGFLPRTVNGQGPVEPTLESWVKVDLDYPPDGHPPSDMAPHWLAAQNAAGTPPKLLEPSVTPEALNARYPATALIRNIPPRTATLLDVLVGPDGAVQDLKIRQSSSFGVLDALAMDVVQSWRFSPAIQNGRAVMGHSQVSVPWKGESADRLFAYVGERF